MEENFFRSLDLLPDAVVWFDEQANLVEVNETAANMWGYSKDELKGMTIFDINPNMSPENWGAHWKDKVERSQMFESSHKTIDGREFPVEIRDHFITIGAKKLSCAIIRDISVRKLKEAALRGALLEIKELKEKLEQEK